jgi:uncharacterized protein YjbJ (UPF0337 family)
MSPGEERGSIVDDDTRMRFEGRWQAMRGRVKEAWGDLTDDDLDKTEGKWDQVVGAVGLSLLPGRRSIHPTGG